MAYDWQTAYQNHLRTAHGRSHMNIDEAKIKMCPQTMFACGRHFEGVFKPHCQAFRGRLQQWPLDLFEQNPQPLETTSRLGLLGQGMA
jgi:hypothetical protein